MLLLLLLILAMHVSTFPHPSLRTALNVIVRILGENQPRPRGSQTGWLFRGDERRLVEREKRRDRVFARWHIGNQGLSEQRRRLAFPSSTSCWWSLA
jgi:hypothetical protein